MMRLIVIYSVMMMMSLVTSYAQSTAALSKKEQSIVTISAFTANGDISNLKREIKLGLDAGLTVNEIKEIIVQLYAYAGFPRSLNALNAFIDVLKERKKNGINDPEGKIASPYPANKSKLEFGTENQTRLVGTPVKGEVYEFAPAIDQFLKEHLFGDIFGRDVLDWKTREIVTIAALASLSGTSNQLRSHINVGMHNGLTPEQLDAIISIIKTKVGAAEGNNATTVLRGVLKRDQPEANKNFTGSVYVSMLVSADSVFNTHMGYVTFDPGSRTNWHYHPSGQILLITEGTAFYQEKGKPKQTLLKGQVAKCPPGVIHWHGATRDGSMTHIAMSSDLEKGSVVWLEKVTDEEYEK